MTPCARQCKRKMARDDIFLWGGCACPLPKKSRARNNCMKTMACIFWARAIFNVGSDFKQKNTIISNTYRKIYRQLPKKAQNRAQTPPYTRTHIRRHVYEHHHCVRVCARRNIWAFGHYYYYYFNKYIYIRGLAASGPCPEWCPSAAQKYSQRAAITQITLTLKTASVKRNGPGSAPHARTGPIVASRRITATMTNQIQYDVRDCNV